MQNFTVPEYAFQFIGYDTKTLNTSPIYFCYTSAFYVCAEKIISY